MTAWLLVAGVVSATTLGEVMQAIGMRRHGEVRDFRPTALGRLLGALSRNRYVMGSVVCSAVSFFLFLKLISIADLSFAVPATALSFVLETILAKTILRERVDGRRWSGALLVAAGVGLLSL